MHVETGAKRARRVETSSTPETRSFLLVSPALAFVLLFLVVPFAGLVAVSFAQFDGLNVTWQFTLEHYQRVLTEKSIMSKSINVCNATMFTSLICNMVDR